MDYRRLVYALLKTLLDIQRALLLKYVEIQRQGHSNGWTLDEFLYQLIDKLPSTRIGQTYKNVFYPGRNSETNLLRWNWHMLHFVLRNYCPDLPEDIKEGFVRLKQMIHELRVGAIDTREACDRNTHVLVSILERYASFIDDETVAREVTERIRQLVDFETEIGEEFEPDTEVENWHNEEKSLTERMTEITPGKI